MNLVHPRRSVDHHNNTNNRNVSGQHLVVPANISVPPPPPPPPPSLLTEISGGFSKNMDLHNQRERPALVGHDSHSLFGSGATSVWRLSTQYSSPSSSSSSSSFSSSPSSSSSSTTSATATATATTATCTHTTSQPHSYFLEEEDEDCFIPENEYPAADSVNNDRDQDPDTDTDTDAEADTYPVETEFTQLKYRYKHIFSNSTPSSSSSPASSASLTTYPYCELSFNIMTGPDRTPHTSSSHRANPLIPANQPPRPPNAWILYRSDKLKNIPSPPPGAPKRPQAEVSKMISQMWKLETPDVRAHYERLSEIKKAEHQAMYPGYRFQPMKKEDKDRLRAEKQAEKDREREARKASRKTRVVAASSSVPHVGGPTAELPPLFTTEARVLPASLNNCNTPVSAPSFPSSSGFVASSSSSSSLSSGHHHPGDLPTPPDDSGGSTPHQPSSSSATTTTTLPPLVAPQPTPLPHRPPSPSTWEEEQRDPIAGPSSNSNSLQQQQQQPDTSFSFDSIPTWFDSSLFLPDPPSGADSYITVPLPSQQPLGWSPDDPGPLSDMHLAFFDPSSSSSSSSSHPTLSLRTTNLPSSQTQPQTDLSPPPPPPPTTTTATTATVHPDQLQLHAVLAATNDPNIFSLDFDFTNNDLFDGTREIQVSMAPGPSMMLSAFNDLGMGMGINPGSGSSATGHANDDLTNLLNWDASNFASSSNHFLTGSYHAAGAGGSMDYSLPLGLDLGIDMDMDSAMDSFNASSSNSAPLDMGTSLSSSSMSLSGAFSMSMMSAPTPSLTSANTSQTSLNPTPPPPLHARGSEDDDERTEKGSRTVSRSNSDSNSTPNPIKSSDHLPTTTTTTPYVPPAGAIHASTRRVAADWRRIRAMTPDPELDHHPVHPSNNHSSSPTSNSVQA